MQVLEFKDLAEALEMACNFKEERVVLSSVLIANLFVSQQVTSDNFANHLYIVLVRLLEFKQT